jgi:purine-binding chemotaxis protein CheW
LITAESRHQADTQPEVPFLLFELANQTYGLPVAPLAHIIEMVTIRPLPQTPAFVKGVINFKGQIVAVLDLRLRLGLPAKPYGLHTPIILLHFDKQLLGLVVDAAHKVHFITQAHLSSGEAIMPLKLAHTEELSIREIQVERVIQADHDLILILDIETLLTESEQMSLLQAMIAERI